MQIEQQSPDEVAVSPGIPLRRSQERSCPTHPQRDATQGEMQHISAGSRGIVHSEENLEDVVEHNYQMWLIPDRRGTASAYHQLKFTPEERQGRFRLYISREGDDNTDARIYAGLFNAGDSVRHSIHPGWGSWIQVVHGELRVAGAALRSGDGIGITNTRELDIQFDAGSEVLLFDVRMDVPLLWR